MPINKKQSFSIIAVLLVFLGWALAEQEFEFKTLMELKFDKEIEDVAFDSYEENGETKFYPKIVVLREVDPVASKGTLVNYALEVRILNQKGKVIKKISNLRYFSRIYLSKNGKYFGIERVTSKDPLAVYNEREIVRADFTVYNDRGEIKWKIEGQLNYDTPFISSYDGSVFLTLSEEGLLGAYALDHFDKKGHRKSIIPIQDLTVEIYKNIGGVLFADDGTVAAVRIQEEGNEQVRQLILALLDYKGNILWEYPINEKFFGETKVSPKGSYVFTDCYSWEARAENLRNETLPKKTPIPLRMRSANVFILNKAGILWMKIPTRISTSAVSFSNNERFLHFCDFKHGDKNFSIKVDLYTKSEIFRKEVPQRFIWSGVSDKGWVAGISMFENAYELNLMDPDGNLVAQHYMKEIKTEPLDEIPAFSILGWSGDLPIFGLVQHKSKVLKIFSFVRR
uniref:Uncharacterized protein n=1 Tax=candidate division WOR-3 bacterium TaxID=2052148 RepID=A0A7C6A873_UNCW3